MAEASQADKDFLKAARERLKDCVEEETVERKKMLDDLVFCTLDQWPEQIRNARENDPNGARPCLTIDKINQYIVQVVNDMRQNRPAVKIRPVDDQADIETAKIFSGLIRHIEEKSDASVAYETAGESAVKIGMGYFRIGTRYTNRKMNEQELYVGRIPDSFSVYLGPHIMPDGSDTEYGFIIREVPEDEFKREFPNAKVAQEEFNELGSDLQTWRTSKTVTVCEYFYREYEKTGDDDVEQTSYSIRWCKMTGIEKLESTDWAGKYIPIVEVIGRESFVKGRRILWGLVRPAKDSLRMNNYWMSSITEKIGLAPKVPFIGAEGQFEGREQEWQNANRENRAFLQYKAVDINGTPLPPPQRVAPVPVEVAMVNMTALIERDVKAALGMYKAAVGDSESQQSGRAILALQKESDTGTYHFQDNLSRSIKHAGRIMVDLAPKIYDTRRVIRILGEDGTSQAVQLDPEQPQSRMGIPQQGGGVTSIYNIGVGEFDVAVTVGPSYTTARQEAATVLTELANSAKDPASAAVMRYLAVKNSDFAGSDEMTRMLKALLPPALQQDPNQQENVPPAAAAQIAQMKQMLQMASQKIQELESGESQAKIKAQAQLAEAQMRDKLEREKADQDANLTVYKEKLAAKTKIQVAQISAQVKLNEAAISSDTETNIAMLSGQNEREMAGEDREHERSMADADRGAEMAMQGAQMEHEVGMQETEIAAQPAAEGAAAPKANVQMVNLRDMIGGMMQMMQQMGQMLAGQQQAQAEQTQMLAQILSKPKQVTLHKDAAGRPTGATVN